MIEQAIFPLENIINNDNKIIWFITIVIIVLAFVIYKENADKKGKL